MLRMILSLDDCVKKIMELAHPARALPM